MGYVLRDKPYRIGFVRLGMRIDCGGFSMKRKLANYVADFLSERNVRHVFTVTGGGAMHLNDAFGHHPDLRCIYNHHEQACAMAAEGYARLTGEVAAVCVTSGPGGTNALTGVLGGYQDSIPMFVISGQVKRETTTWSTDVPLRQLGDQEFQIVDCVKGMTKYAVMVTDPREIRYHLEKAWYLCVHGRKGPVWLDIPLDVQAAQIETEELVGFDASEEEGRECPAYDPALAKEILEKVKDARRPAILAGTGIRLSGAYAEFQEAVEKLNVPVLTAWNAHDLLPDDHLLYCGRPGSMGLRGGNFITQTCDLLLVLGCRLNVRQISYNYRSFAKDAYKIMVDIDEAELRKPTISIDFPIHADVGDVLRSILAELDGPLAGHEEWLEWCRGINAKYPAVLPQYRERSAPVNPYVFVDELGKELGEGETVVCGNGSACVVTFQAMRVKEGQRLFTNSGCAAMGYGFPAAIGACIAKGGGRVICLDGDGSFQMNIQELQTVAHHRLNLKIIILNNNGYHSIRQTQRNLFEPPLVGVSADNGVSFPDLGKIAHAYGIPYFRIEDADEIHERLRAVLSDDQPALCEVVVDEGQNFEPKLSSRALPDGGIVSPEIDDMSPFLPREEYEQVRRSALEI